MTYEHVFDPVSVRGRALKTRLERRLRHWPNRLEATLGDHHLGEPVFAGLRAQRRSRRASDIPNADHRGGAVEDPATG